MVSALPRQQLWRVCTHMHSLTRTRTHAHTRLRLRAAHCRATCVAFNPFHDQLVLSGGADCRVDLWRVSSVSSAPLLELGEEEGSLPEEEQLAAGGGSSAPSSSGKQPGARMAADIAVRMHVDHVDTVTSVAWSSTRAWVYASLSYTGRVAVSQVSSGERYQVLL